jgi:hypothetical protein
VPPCRSGRSTAAHSHSAGSPEVVDVHRADRVERLAGGFVAGEVGGGEREPAAVDVSGVSGGGAADGGGEAVDDDQVAGGEALCDQPGRYTRSAADLQDSMVGVNIEQIDGPADPVRDGGHGAEVTAGVPVVRQVGHVARPTDQ